MYFELFIFLQFIVGVSMNLNSNFGVDFFAYKDVAWIAKFSCGDAEEDMEFIKLCTNSGIYSSIYHPNLSLSIVKFLEDTYWPIGVWLDTRCIPKPMIDNIIAEASVQRMFGKLHKWLVIGHNFNATLMYLNEDAMSLLNDIVIGVAKSNGSYDLFDVYNPDKLRDGKMNITKFGSWDIDSRLNVELKQHIFSRRWNLHGMCLRIASVAKYCESDVTPLECLTNYRKLGQDLLSKFGLALFLTLGEMFNFRLNITLVDDWYDTYPNGTLFGMMPSLKNEEVDFGSTPASSRWATLNFSRYIIPVWPSRYFFIFRDPTKNVKLTELFKPLANEVWYGMAVVGGLITLILMWILWFEEGGSLYGKWGWGMLITIGALAQQGLQAVPNRTSGRIILLSFMIFIFLMMNYYSARVVTARINMPPDRMNDSLWSLGKVEDMNFATFPYRLINDILRVSKDWEVKSFYEKVWSKILPNEAILPIEVGLEKVRAGSFAYHANPSAIYPYITNHFEEEIMCELNEIHVLKPHLAALFERLNNPFTEITRVGFFKLWSSGVRMRNVFRWEPPKYECSANIRSTRPLTMYDVVTAFILLIVGMIVSAFFLTFEIIIYRINELRDERKKFGKRLKPNGGKSKIIS